MSSPFGFEVSASFEELVLPPDDPVFAPVADERGVLMACWVPRGRAVQVSPKPPDIIMKWAKTNQNIGHNTLLDKYPDSRYARNRQPVMAIPIAGSGFRVAARYLLEAEGSLSVNLMLGPIDRKQDVRELSGYRIARHRLGVACAQVILAPLAERDTKHISVKISNNFENRFLKATEPWIEVGNIQQFNEHLHP